jgi:hypothetical protein
LRVLYPIDNKSLRIVADTRMTGPSGQSSIIHASDLVGTEIWRTVDRLVQGRSVKGRSTEAIGYQSGLRFLCSIWISVRLESFTPILGTQRLAALGSVLREGIGRPRQDQERD